TESLSPQSAIETMRAIAAGIAGVRNSEIFVRKTRLLEIRSKNQELSTLREKMETALAMRLSKEDACVVVATSNLTAHGLKELLVQGRALLRSAQQGPLKKIPDISADTPELNFDGSFGDVPLEEKVS